MVALAASSLLRAAPVPRTRLIGREAERAAARALLLEEAVPLLTFTGPGGVGKTRLSLAVAQEMAEHFADGIVWVDLAPLADPALVPAAVIAALDVAPTAYGSPTDDLRRVLQTRQTLLLLDNCEHLLHATSDLVAALLSACPALQVLATSRASLRLRGEQELPIEPFLLPETDARLDAVSTNDAVRLFVERAHAVDHRFVLEEGNATTVAAVCRRLEGLPLAIELAAARMKVLSPEALLRQMDDRLRLLRGGPRDLPARQQTLRDTIAWSYALLESDQQTFLRRLAVFAGGWTVAAATAVASDPPASAADVLDEIGVLVDQSLVRRVESAGEARFTMLETIREFGLAELIAAEEEEEIRGRHAAWVRAMVEALDLHRTMQRDTARMSRLVPEQDNVRQALAWFAARGDAQSLNIVSAAMSIFWPSRGQFAESRKWLQEALAHDADVPQVIRARIWHEAGWLAMCQGELDVAKPLHDKGLRLARQAGEPYLLAEAILSAGTLAFWQGDLARAAALMEEGQLAFAALGNEYPSALMKAGAAVILLGNIAVVKGDLPLALQRGEEAVTIATELGATAELGYALCGLGYAELLNGDIAAAAAHFLEATARTWASSDEAFLARLLWAMAGTSAVDQPDIAARLIGAADAIDARTGSAMWPADRTLADWCLARLLDTLDPVAFATMRGAGATLTTEQAVAIARLVAATMLSEERATAIWQSTGAPDPAVSGAALLARLRTEGAGADLARDDLLTQHEREILDLMCQRLSDPEIAARLGCDLRAVEVHVSGLFTKLGVTNRRDAAAVAARQYGLTGKLQLMERSVLPVFPGNVAHDAAAATNAGLTPRELDVLGQLFLGRSDREIATALYISRRTVSKHVEAILAKLGARSRGAAVAEARRLGFAAFPPGEQDSQTP